MPTLTVGTPRRFARGDFAELPMIGGDIIYEGAAVGDNASGYCRPLVAGDPFRGFSVETDADNSAGSDGDKNVKMQTEGKIVLDVVGVSGVDNVGALVYAADDNLFTLTSASNTLIGVVYAWETGTRCVVSFRADQIAGSKVA